MSDQGWGDGETGSPGGGGYPPPPPPPSPGGYAGFGGEFVPPAGGPTALASNPNYPVTAGLDAPLEIARWRVIGNIILAIPHFIVLYVLRLAAEVLTIGGWFAIVFTGTLPTGIGTFVAGVHRYEWRVITYALYLREPYPSFGIPSGYADPGGDPAWLNIVPPQQYSRLAVIFRFLLALPQLLWGIVLGIGIYVAMIVAFFAVLITGRWPAGLRKFVVGVEFWGVRLNAWYALLTDPYPPFTID